MALGWFIDLTEANAYFTVERLETEAWDDLTPAATLKPKVIINAYNRLYYDVRWLLPTFADATAAEREILKRANAEMAYYLALHLEDEDRRKGIQAQATIEAGVVKEKYDKDKLDAAPVPAVVIAMLVPWLVDPIMFGAIDLARDEEESVNTKVHNF
jgi:hypothetical protein